MQNIHNNTEKINTNNFLERISTSPLMKDFHLLLFLKSIHFTLIYLKQIHPHKRKKLTHRLKIKNDLDYIYNLFVLTM